MPQWAELKPSIVFHCDDIDGTCGALKQGGVKFEKELAEVPWRKFASFLDSDGNEFGLRGR
jgi:lactoylglutathione lyase